MIKNPQEIAMLISKKRKLAMDLPVEAEEEDEPLEELADFEEPPTKEEPSFDRKAFLRSYLTHKAIRARRG